MNQYVDKQTEQAIDQWIDSHRDEFIRDIGRLVSIRSVTEPQEGEYPFGEGCAKVLDEALDMARGYGFATENLGYRCGAVSSGDSGRRIGIFAHVDIVPEGNGWSRDPFQVSIENGYLIGRGVCDDKGPAMAGLYAMRCIKELKIQETYHTVLVLGCNEEGGMGDIGSYLDAHGAPAFSFTPDAEFPVCNGEKGIMEFDLASQPVCGDNSVLADFQGGLASNMVPDRAFAVLRGIPMEKVEEAVNKRFLVQEVPEGIKITAEGISAHAANPYAGDSAIYKLAVFLSSSGLLSGKELDAVRAIERVVSDVDGMSLGVDLMDEPSGRLTHIGGTIKVRDGKLILNNNIRYPVTANGDEIAAQIKETASKLNLAVEDLSDNPPYYIELGKSPVGKAVEALLDAYGHVAGKKEPPYVMGGGTYARKVANAVAFGPEFPGAESPFGQSKGHAHEPDECISVDQMLKAVKIYTLALAALNQLEL